MSKASEWAHRLLTARAAFEQANKERPEFELDDGRIQVFVMELGEPKLVAGDGRNMVFEIRPGTDELIEFALKIIETFVDEDTDLKLIRRIAGAIELCPPSLRGAGERPPP